MSRAGHGREHELQPETAQEKALAPRVGRSPIQVLIPSRECFHYGRHFTPLSPTQFFFSTICILKNQGKDESGKQKVNILTN